MEYYRYRSGDVFNVDSITVPFIIKVFIVKSKGPQNISGAVINIYTGLTMIFYFSSLKKNGAPLTVGGAGAPVAPPLKA